ncbi:Excinuclease ABC C subunit domain protein [Pseudopedobacter saltans DSM 12145]|uniref:Excinuclease ABC C subunit domain protein n=1 Tax=Pseudopedobacter saltans (strain ATCC 51119 / DSM 12145 / JCM 21818 / CCUG 39354 / LMG 10337 / NBRC 100064 / NCIMB 13643) TaxID=762903 RepID=F0SD97_PSESL|nr:GIY-YIG nuclease family protein [Pseudopedobacter saltans]ADY52883.1 Excinuclease ABC C subunit domain protein [Pseudopedobacter saltans DSM 12145]
MIKSVIKQYSVYIMTNRNNTVLYTGVTNDLERRIWEHKFENGSKFTSLYKCHKLVYYEDYASVKEAIAREKQIKAGPRSKKLELINLENPNWSDLSKDWF